MSTDAPDPRWPDGVGRVVLDDTDSTMAEAARRAPDLQGPTWILARRQSTGRGRRGRPWRHPLGNFAATLVTRPERPPAEAALASFQAALALHDVLSAYVSAERLALKWPNDVLLEGGKVAGILLESAGAGPRLDWMAIGIGINLAEAPSPDAVEPGAVRPVAVSEYVTPPDPLDVLTGLAAAMAAYDAQWKAAGFAALRRAWLARAARLGETITARTPREAITGRFDGIDAEGHLLLDTATGPRTIAAAEVHFSDAS